jgi:hypothetical protein
MYKIDLPEENPIPKYARLGIISLIVVTITFVLMLASRHNVSTIQPAPVKAKQVTEDIVPDKDITLGNELVTIFIPKGATDLSGNLSIIPLEANLFPEAGAAGWTHPAVVKIQFKDGNGVLAPTVNFSQPVLVCFKLNQAQMQDYEARVTAYQIQYYADSLRVPRWVPLPLYAYPDRLQLCGATNHFSIFALSVDAAGSNLTYLNPVTGGTENPTGSTDPTIPPTDSSTHGNHGGGYFLSVGPTGVLLLRHQPILQQKSRPLMKRSRRMKLHHPM